MSTTWYLGDSHFSHRNIIKFADADGNRHRPWDTIEEHDQAIVDAINEHVGEHDKLIHMGDVAMNPRGLNLMHAIKCQNRVLIPGNHDMEHISKYTELFKDIKGCKVLRGAGMIVSHYPVHPSQLDSRYRFNIHAHTHANLVLDKFGQPDPRYICLSLEQTNFRPVSFDEIVKIAESRNI